MASEKRRIDLRDAEGRTRVNNWAHFEETEEGCKVRLLHDYPDVRPEPDWFLLLAHEGEARRYRVEKAEGGVLSCSLDKVLSEAEMHEEGL